MRQTVLKDLIFGFRTLGHARFVTGTGWTLQQANRLGSAGEASGSIAYFLNAEIMKCQS